MVTLEERISNAMSLRQQGYNCAQCVAMTFNPGLDTVTAGLGTGIGATGHICGCCSAMAILTSIKSYKAPADKPQLYSEVRKCIEKFAALNNGDTDCRDLRKPGRKPCTELIKDAIVIMHETL